MAGLLSCSRHDCHQCGRCGLVTLVGLLRVGLRLWVGFVWLSCICHPLQGSIVGSLFLGVSRSVFLDGRGFSAALPVLSGVTLAFSGCVTCVGGRGVLNGICPRDYCFPKS